MRLSFKDGTGHFNCVIQRKKRKNEISETYIKGDGSIDGCLPFSMC